MKKTTNYGDCPRCGGTGQIVEEGYAGIRRQCDRCGGSGRVIVSIVEEDSWPWWRPKDTPKHGHT